MSYEFAWAPDFTPPTADFFETLRAEFADHTPTGRKRYAISASVLTLPAPHTFDDLLQPLLDSKAKTIRSVVVRGTDKGVLGGEADKRFCAQFKRNAGALPPVDLRVIRSLQRLLKKSLPGMLELLEWNLVADKQIGKREVGQPSYSIGQLGLWALSVVPNESSSDPNSFWFYETDDSDPVLYQPGPDFEDGMLGRSLDQMLGYPLCDDWEGSEESLRTLYCLWIINGWYLRNKRMLKVTPRKHQRATLVWAGEGHIVVPLSDLSEQAASDYFLRVFKRPSSKALDAEHEKARKLQKQGKHDLPLLLGLHCLWQCSDWDFQERFPSLSEAYLDVARALTPASYRKLGWKRHAAMVENWCGQYLTPHDLILTS
jgi:hypothetical protein